MSNAADTAPLPASRAVRIALVVIAAVEAAGALSNAGSVFNVPGGETALDKIAQILTVANLVLAVPLTLAALYFAAAGQLARAIAALSIRMLVTWVADLPSLAYHGIKWSSQFGDIAENGYRFLAPLVALAALWLASRNTRLGLATGLVALPSIFTWGGVLIFIVSVLKYGF